MPADLVHQPYLIGPRAEIERELCDIGPRAEINNKLTWAKKGCDFNI